MNYLTRLSEILQGYKHYYLLSALLLIVSAFARTLEPRVVQVAIDGIIAKVANPNPATANATQAANVQATEPDFVAQVIYRLLPPIDQSTFYWALALLCALFVGISLVRGLSSFGSGAVNAHVTETAIKHFRDRLFKHLQGLPVAYFGRVKTGEIIQRCTGDMDTIKGFMHTQVTEFVYLTATFVFAFLMMWQIHSTYALVSSAIFPILVLSAYFFFKYENKIWEAHEAEQDKLTSLVEENLSGVRVVKAFAKETFEIDKFDTQNQATRAIGFKHVQLHAYFWTSTDFLIFIQTTLALGYGGYLTVMQQITLGELITFFSYMWMITFPMRQIGRVISQLGMTKVAITRIAEILDTPTENYTGNIKPSYLKGDIEFRNVWFKYQPDDAEYALQNVSFSVKAGEKVAFMGATGAGKSSVIALLMRFYEPEKGTILLDGMPLNDYEKSNLRQRIGVVLQKPFLFSTSIAKNIAYSKPAASEPDVYGAAASAAIHDIIDIFADGYHTLVGEKGVTLSGGQKQRIALARTLLEKPDILVLDDTTSAVDAETEQHIQQALQQYMQQKTTFMIANRISSVADAQQILVFDKGKIVQNGTHAQLIQQAGFYKRVYDVQQQTE
jgi:ATP-binding cassette subfamily B protein